MSPLATWTWTASGLGGRLGGGGAANRSYPPVALEVTAVRDLDLVDPGRWPRALELLARPPLRSALIDRTRVRLADGRHADVPSYTAWWLRRNLVLDGHRPGDLRGPDSDPLLAGLYDPMGSAAPAGRPGDRPRARRPHLAGGPAGRARRPRRAPRPAGRPGPLGLPPAVARPLGGAGGGRRPPPTLPARPGTGRPRGRGRLADADDVLVLDAPDLWPLLADEPLVLAPYGWRRGWPSCSTCRWRRRRSRARSIRPASASPSPRSSPPSCRTPRRTTRRTTSSPSTASSCPGAT